MEVDQADAWWLTNGAESDHAEDAEGCRRPHNQGTTPSDMHPIAPQRRPFRPHFTYLYRLVLTRSRWPQLADQNRFWAHFALPVPSAPLCSPPPTPIFSKSAPLGHGACRWQRLPAHLPAGVHRGSKTRCARRVHFAGGWIPAGPPRLVSFFVFVWAVYRSSASGRIDALAR